MSVNHVPLPLNPFPKRINTTLLAAGTQLHRLYTREYPGNAFNPSTHRLNRFSPIFNEGHPVGVLYAGSTLEAAIHETLFHDAHVRGSTFMSMPLKSLHARVYGGWITQRPLTLATLHAPDLAKFGLTTDQLTATNSCYYPQTARWAEAIHHAHKQVEGLQWTSYRADPALAFMLFGDRVQPSDLASAGNESLIRDDARLFETVVECGLRVGVRVNRPR